MSKVYITHCNEKYLPIAYNLVKSIREFSDIPIIVYGIDVRKSSTYIFNTIPNVYVEIINLNLDDIKNYVYGNNGNFYVDRQDPTIFMTLSSKIYAMMHALESGWDEVCYLDSDCLATPLVDEIFDWSNLIENYPIGTKGIHDYMIIINDGKQYGNPYGFTWPVPDNKLSLEWPLMNIMSMLPEQRLTYSTTGIMLLNQQCKKFVDLWWETCKILPKITNIRKIAPFQEETVYNVLKWREGNLLFPLCYINISDGVNTVKDFYTNEHNADSLVEYDEKNGEKNFYKIPKSKRDVKVLHGEKLTSECDKIILYLKDLKQNGYFQN
jgi:hypothetical protein